MNCCKLVNLLAVLSAGALHAESTFAAEAPGWEKEVVQQANQQKNVVTGTVLDENGFSVPGASVIVVGTTDGTVTDMDGVYSLSLSRKKAVLRFSFIGLKSVDVEYTGQKTLNVVLKSDNQVLDDVVVIGYGSKNRKSLTSSISSVKKEDLNKLSKTSSTVQDMLGGTIKGVLVTQNSGEPGATMTVNVRGITSPYPIATSLTANNAPLYVIDGVPMFVDSNALNPLMNIAPNDIESIDVLKDASATAIYGSRGANGVIIVTTKNGRKGEKATVEAGYTLSIANPVKIFKPLNNQEFRSLQEEILRNTMDAYNYDMANFTMTTQYSIMYDPTMLMAYGNFDVDWNTLMYTKFLGLNESAFGKENINWEDETRNKNAITNQYNVSVRGGSEKTDYSFAFNAIDQEGLYKNDNLGTYSGRLSVNTEITKRIRMGALLSYSYSKRTSPSQESIMMPDTHPWLVRPDLPIYDENGDYTRLDKSAAYFTPAGSVSGPNPVALLNRKAEYESDQFMGNVYVDVELLRNLKFHSDFTLASYNYDNSYFSPSYLQEIWVGSPYYAQLTTARSKYVSTSINFRLDYNYHTGKHLFGAMAGYGADRTRSTGGTNMYQGFPNDDNLDNVGSAQSVLMYSDYVVKSGLNSIYGRLSYDYDSRYLLEVSMRADASSKFGPGNQWGVFPAVSTGWVISREAFMEKAPWVNNLKMRLSWGQTGSTNVSDFSFRQFYTSSQYGENSSVKLQDLLPNRGIHWEKTNEVNFGLDFSFFDDRLYGSLDAYYRYTNGALAPAPHVLESGMTSYYDNIIDVSNRGVEVAIGGYPVRGKNFSWSSDLNISVNRNRIESLNNAQINSYMQDAFIVGRPAGTVKGYVVDHIVQNMDEVNQLNAKAMENGYAEYQSGTGVGDFLMKDIDGNGVITSDDRDVIATPEAKFFGGWTNTFTYKNFSLSFLMQFSYGGQAVYSNLGEEMSGVLGQSVGRELYGNTWTPERTDAKYARLVAGSMSYNYQVNDRFVFDTSYLRMKNVTFSYSLPKEWINKCYLSNASVFVTATNLFTVTKWPGLDPETVSTGITSMGTNSDPYPLSRSFSLGVKLQF